jgi:translocation and assembly module TamB
MRALGRILRWLGAALGVVIVLLAAAFGLLQTRTGQDWLARTVERTISAPDFTVAIGRLSGTVPFQLRVDRIEIGDRDGTYLTVHDFRLDTSAAALLARRLHIRSLSFAEIDMARQSTAPSTTPLTEYLKVPHVPIGVVLDRLSIERLALAPPILGESLVATVQGSAELADGRAHIALDLHRMDDVAGNIVLAMDLAGTTPVLKLLAISASTRGGARATLATRGFKGRLCRVAQWRRRESSRVAGGQPRSLLHRSVEQQMSPRWRAVSASQKANAVRTPPVNVSETKRGPPRSW